MTINQLEKILDLKFIKDMVSLCQTLHLRCMYFFTKSVEIKPVFNSIRKGAGLQLNISVKCLDYLTLLLIVLLVAKILMPFMDV